MGARAICLDAYCTDDAGKKYDIEIQRADAEATNYYKKDPKGVMEVSKIMDEFKEEVLYDDRVDTAKRIIEFGNISLEQISQVTKLPLEVIQKLANPEVNNG